MIDCSNIRIKKGSSGTNVKELQQILKQYGVYTGVVDGAYGDLSISAVKQFQTLTSITVDGWIGTETCKAIQQYTKLSAAQKKGSTGVYVRIIQQKLKALGYYTASIDGEYGDKTVTSVKSYQKSTGKLLVDGIVGEVTYQSLLNTTKKNTTTTNNTSCSSNGGIYTSGPHYETAGCNREGQCTGYWCACVSFSQILKKWGITRYTQKTIASYMGTTTAGTGHGGIETGINKIARLEGITLKVKWVNFSDLGNTVHECFKELGRLMSQPDKGVIVHDLYRNRFGHYETMKTINTNNSNITVLNSLGNKCNSPAFCGYNESRSFSTMRSYIGGISQKSICIITKE